MTDSDNIAICAVKDCKAHLNKKYAKVHPTISGGFLCPDHASRHVERMTMLDYLEKAYSGQHKRSEPIPPHKSPWTQKQLERLTKGLVFEQSFNEVFEVKV